MPPPTGDKLPRVEVTSRAELRRWLAANHSQSTSIWLVTHKRSTGDRYIPYEAIVEEALAFGWIDSLPRRLDAERSMRLLSPRKAGSAWSKVNKQRIMKLQRLGLMAAPGIRAIERAKVDGSWRRLDRVETLRIPADLDRALRDNDAAHRHFSNFPPSSKRLILEWINQARRPETRLRRIEETVARAARDERAHHYRQPNKASR